MAKNVRVREPVETVSAPMTDAAALPPPVAAMRQKILQACAKGDIEALRIPIDWNELRPLFERGARRPPGEDPVARLKALSADSAGQEILSLLRAVLRQAFVKVERGPTTLYVWPAFALRPPADPTPQEREIMLTCVRFADLSNPKADGKATPMELAIGADGVWHTFWTALPHGQG